MNKEIFEKIFKEHSKKIKNKNISNPSLMICFSGIPGSGKTSLAKKFERKYKGVRISNDQIRRIIEKLKISDLKDIIHEYDYYILENYPYKNKLIILDSSIDRKYKKVFEIAKKKKWKVFVIKMGFSYEEIIKRMKKREGKEFPYFLDNFKRWKRDYQNFNKKVKADFIFKYKKDIKHLFSELDKKV